MPVCKYQLKWSKQRRDPDTPKTRPDEIHDLLLGAEELFPRIKKYKYVNERGFNRIFSKN